jgi:hypothetical protein
MAPHLRSVFVATAAVAALLASVIECLAAPVTVPTGLNPGDQYRLAFVTSTARDATSSNIADYNAFVTGVANTVPELVALGTSWTAIGSTSTVAARDNTSTNPFVNGTGVKIYRLNDTLRANDYTDLWGSESVNDHLEIDESGETVFVDVWTGTNFDGTIDPSGPLGDALPWLGDSNALGITWIHFYSGEDSTTPLGFYAISDVLTVIPEPGTGLLVMSGLLGLAYRQRRYGRARRATPSGVARTFCALS